MKVDQPIALAQSIETDASPCSQRIPTDLVILDFEPTGSRNRQRLAQQSGSAKSMT